MATELTFETYWQAVQEVENLLSAAEAAVTELEEGFWESEVKPPCLRLAAEELRKAHGSIAIAEALEQLATDTDGDTHD